MTVELGKDCRIPIKAWVPDAASIESGCIDQAKNLANLPYAVGHVALMPDTHHGYGMPIGGVLVTEGVIIPNAVGVDIGCGMLAYRTGLKVNEDVLAKRDEIVAGIKRNVPVGFNVHDAEQSVGAFDALEVVSFDGVEPIHDDEVMSRAKRSLGTLGGGNHFIELQKDQDDNLWVMIHSGSRNFGLKVAQFFNKKARELADVYGWGVPDSWQLAGLDMMSRAGVDYYAAMNIAMDFARENREAMLLAVADAIETAIGYPLRDFTDTLDVHHNYAEQYGEHDDVFVHRKGAVKAKGRVIIPGSMGTASYIARGLENPESFESCSHGAGRVMSRSQAKKNVDGDAALAKMAAADITFRPDGEFRDEVADAYKPIDEVMENQADLVEIETELRPIAVVKG